MQKTLTIGLPRAMLYYSFRVLWKVFFRELGVQVIVSPPTDRQILEEGAALAIDESCLSAKIYLGHVKALTGKCDYILIPWVSNFGWKRDMCTRFQSLPDLTKNVFRDSGQKFLTYQLDIMEKKDEKSAFVDLGSALGFTLYQTKRAYARAKKEEQAQYKTRIRAEEQLYQSDGLKIMIAAHSYSRATAFTFLEKEVE